MLITRTHFADRTEGILTLPDGQQIATLERPWLNNKPFVSCVPPDSYIVDRDKTGRFQWYKLREVTGRSFIEIHLANKADQLEGCIAPCMYIKNGVGYGSLEACELILKWFGDNSFVLEIR
jgi:hypothetical protein